MRVGRLGEIIHLIRAAALGTKFLDIDVQGRCDISSRIFRKNRNSKIKYQDKSNVGYSQSSYILRELCVIYISIFPFVVREWYKIMPGSAIDS